jgi:hypothetical protein
VYPPLRRLTCIARSLSSSSFAARSRSSLPAPSLPTTVSHRPPSVPAAETDGPVIRGAAPSAGVACWRGPAVADPSSSAAALCCAPLLPAFSLLSALCCPPAAARRIRWYHSRPACCKTIVYVHLPPAAARRARLPATCRSSLRSRSARRRLPSSQPQRRQPGVPVPNCMDEGGAHRDTSKTIHDMCV